jgi:hypothetical protein
MKENVHEEHRMAAITPLLIYYAKVNGSILRIHPWQSDCQWSVNNVLLSIMGTLHGDWLQRLINDVQAAFIGKREIDTLPARFLN